jgi:hypothetical protein
MSCSAGSLLTHLRSLGEALAVWAGVAAPGGLLVVHETESLEARHPALRLYYRLLEQLPWHHGQTLQVGVVLENGFAGSGWRVVESQRRLLEKPRVTWPSYTWRTFAIGGMTSMPGGPSIPTRLPHWRHRWAELRAALKMAALSSMRHARSSPSADDNSLPGETGDISHSVFGHARHNTTGP